jgi:uncharacterized membrane protein
MDNNFFLSMLLGVSVASMPYIVSKSIAFGVRIPSSQFKNVFLKRLRLSWVILNLVFFGFVGFTDSIDLINQTNQNALFGVIAYNLIVFVIFNQIVKRYKAKQDWQESKKVVIPLNSELTKFNYKLLYGFVFIIIITIITTNYFGIFELNVILEQVVATLMYGLLVYTSLKSRKTISAANPDQSLKLISDFRNKVIVSIVALGFVLVSMIGFGHFRDQGLVTGNIYNQVLIATFIIFGLLFINIMYAGNKRNRDEVENELLEHNDDKYWKFGLVYVNKNDSSLFVEKRNSIGWTVNFGNKYIIVFIIILITFYLVIGYLGG